MSSATSTRAAATALPDERFIPAGTVIFRQGDVGNEMFVIGEGSVSLTITSADGHEANIGVFGKGDFFGELSLMSAEPRSATATTVEDSVLLVVKRDVFIMMVQDDIAIVARMMTAQGRRLSRANEPIQQLTQQLARIRIWTLCLRQALASEPPYAFDVQTLARDLDFPAPAVTASFEALAEQGVGVLESDRWKLVSRADVARLAEAIYRGSAV